MRHPLRISLGRCNLCRGNDRQIVEAMRDGRKTVFPGEGLQVREDIEHPLIRHFGASSAKVNDVLIQP
jgi:hypothetical protein